MKDHNAFKFSMIITKAEMTEGQSPKMTIKGVASSTKVDAENHRFTREGLEAMKKSFEDGYIDEDGDWSPIPLRSGHRTEWEDVLGWVTKAEIDEDDNLWITAELDEDSSKAHELYRKISRGNSKGHKSKLGLSVRGEVTKWRENFDHALRKNIVDLSNIKMKEVSVTSQPKNPAPYPLAIAKSLLADQQNLEEDSMDKENTTIQEEQEVAIDAEKAAPPDDSITRAFANAVGAPAEEVEVTVDPADAQAANNDVPITNTAATSDAQVETVAAEAAEKIERNEDVVTVPAPVVESEPQEAPVVTDTVATPVVATEEQAAQPETKTVALEELQRQLAELTETFTAFAASQKEVQKSVEDSPEPPIVVSKSLEEQIDHSVSKALQSLGLTKLFDELAVVKGALNTLANQPADKSITVAKAKDEESDDDPFVKMKSLKEQGDDPLRAAFGAAYRKN